MSNVAKQIEQGALLDVENLTVSFKTDEGVILAVDGISFSVKRGQTLGIVGESGSGKSVCTKAVMQLLPKTATIHKDSSIKWQHQNGEIIEITGIKKSSREMRHIRGGEIGMIFQEPMSSFSPVHTIGNQIIEAVLEYHQVNKLEAREIAIDMLDKVGISNPSVRIDQYSFELSGGMRQRAMIAVALSMNPVLLIADEPTTSLDVTIQAQILKLMKQLQEEFGMAIIFITHNLGVIAQVADEVEVMYLGKILERGTAKEIIRQPQHPYTQALLRAIPQLDRLGERLMAISGDIPSPLERPSGCPFHTRCEQVIPGLCDTQNPNLTRFSSTHTTHCFLHEERDV
ncbi:MAG: ABC transporter ATP-binding protein [Anaerolineales bacterium]|nr:ABC transporter ATP-binding protein [Anaerolineales bacterium]